MPALDPDEVIRLPDGTEDAWSEDLADLKRLPQRSVTPSFVAVTRALCG